MFTIDWENIQEQGFSASWEAPVAEFETLTSLLDQGIFSCSSPVTAKVQAHWISDLLEVRGEVAWQISVSCSRCLKQFEKKLTGYFGLTFVREMPEINVTEDDESEGYELSADELGLIYAPEETIDLHDVYAEQLILSLPVRPLCDPGCAGLCIKCGQDLNQGRCSCEKDIFNNKFAALKNLNLDKE